MRTYFASVCKDICGTEIELEVEFKVHSFGSSASFDDPGDGPEIEIVKIVSADTGRDLTQFCNEVRDLWGKSHFAWGLCRFHHGVYTPEMWVRGVGFVQTGPRKGHCRTEHGYPMLDDAISEEICTEHMPDPYDDYDDRY